MPKLISFFIFLLFSLIACSSNYQNSNSVTSEIKFLKRLKPPEHLPLFNRQALLVGRLFIKDNCLYVKQINIAKSNDILTIWKWSDSLSKSGSSTFSISDATKKRTAIVGKIGRFGGGYITIDKKKYNDCRIYNRQIFEVDFINLIENGNKTRQILRKYM